MIAGDNDAIAFIGLEGKSAKDRFVRREERKTRQVEPETGTERRRQRQKEQR